MTKIVFEITRPSKLNDIIETFSKNHHNCQLTMFKKDSDYQKGTIGDLSPKIYISFDGRVHALDDIELPTPNIEKTINAIKEFVKVEEFDGTAMDLLIILKLFE